MQTGPAVIDGQQQMSAVKIERCRYLAESGCAAMCVNLCKAPCQVSGRRGRGDGGAWCWQVCSGGVARGTGMLWLARVAAIRPQPAFTGLALRSWGAEILHRRARDAFDDEAQL